MASLEVYRTMGWVEQELFLASNLGMNDYHEKLEAQSFTYDGDFCIRKKGKVPEMCQLYQRTLSREKNPCPGQKAR